MKATEAAQRTTVAGIPVITGGPEKNHEDREAECANRGGLWEKAEIKMELSEMRKVTNRTSVQPAEQRPHEAKHLGANTVRSTDFKYRERVQNGFRLFLRNFLSSTLLEQQLPQSEPHFPVC